MLSIASVILVSLVSLVGVVTLALREATMKRILMILVSFSAGALLGDAFIHLLPEAADDFGFSYTISSYVLVGIIFFFLVEKGIHWRHCHVISSSDHPHHLAPMNLMGDGVHNFIDGLIIGASYLASVPVGIATTLAVMLHEIPQEVGDFGILIYSGLTKRKAIAYNFLTALTAVIGALVSLFLFSAIDNSLSFLLPFAAGGFIYIASSDLIPELHKTCEARPSIVQVLSFLIGIGMMFSLLVLHI